MKLEKFVDPDLHKNKLDWILNKGYKAKAYIDVGVGRIGWITSKFQDIAAVMIIVDWFNLQINHNQMKSWIIWFYIGCLIFGLWYKKNKLYDREMIAASNVNVVSWVQYQAAKIIIEENERKTRRKQTYANEHRDRKRCK